MENLISINQAAKLGILRIRKANWKRTDDYLKIYIYEEHPGPWGELYSKVNALLNERNPIKFPLFCDWDNLEYEPYHGEISQDENIKRVII